MTQLLALLKAAATLGPDLLEVVLEIVRALKNHPNPLAAARRALVEAKRVSDFDQRMASKPAKN